MPDLIAALWTGVRRLQYTFFNSAPTMQPTGQAEDPVNGVITGSLGDYDADGDVVTYTVTSGPQHGVVEISASGNYTYTPGSEFALAGGTDSFTVVADDQNSANPWHTNLLSDVLGGVNRLLAALGIVPLRQPSSTTVTIVGVPTAAAPGGVFAPYIDMGSIGQREQTWYMNNSTSPATSGTPSLVATMAKTGIEAATLAFVNQQSSGGPLIWGSSPSGGSNIAFDSARGIEFQKDIKAAVDAGLLTIVSFGGISAAQNGTEIGQINGEAATTKSDQVTGTGQSTLTLTLEQPIDFATAETNSISGRFTINDAVTETFTVDAERNLIFTHQVTYEVPKAIGGTLSADGATLNIQLDSALYANQGKAAAVVSYGLQVGFDRMKQAYQDAIQYFYDLGVRHFDLDIEGPALAIDQWGINNQRLRVFKSFQDENTFPGMELSFVLPIGPNIGWHPITDPGRLIQAAGQIGLDVATWNMMAFDYGPQTYAYMLEHDMNMVDMLIGEADTGITVDPYFPIKGAVDYLVDYGLATDRQDAFSKLGVTLMIGQDDTVYVTGATPEGFNPGDAATVEAITPDEVGDTGPAVSVMDWAQENGVGLLSFWSLGRDRPSFNTTSYNPTWSVAYQTGSPAVPNVDTNKVAGDGATQVGLTYQSAGRQVAGGNLFALSGDWLGTFEIQSGNTVHVLYAAARPVKLVGGTIDQVSGQMQVNFDGPLNETVWAKLDYQPTILIEYQDRDLLYTDILNAFD